MRGLVTFILVLASGCGPAVTLHTPVPDGTGLSLSWTQADPTSFREYKLYRHTTSGLDQTTGTLVHVSTSVTATTHVDLSGDANTLFFYRLYVVPKLGPAIGSNIVSATNPSFSILPNGGFEEGSGAFPDSWKNWALVGPNPFSVATDVFHSGSKSLKVDLGERGFNAWGLFQELDPAHVKPGATYRVSFWLKHPELESLESVTLRLHAGSFSNGNLEFAQLPAISGPAPGSPWQEHSLEFIAPASNVPLELSFGFGRAQGPLDFMYVDNLVMWIDDVRLEKVR